MELILQVVLSAVEPELSQLPRPKREKNMTSINTKKQWKSISSTKEACLKSPNRITKNLHPSKSTNLHLSRRKCLLVNAFKMLSKLSQTPLIMIVTTLKIQMSLILMMTMI